MIPSPYRNLALSIRPTQVRSQKLHENYLIQTVDLGRAIILIIIIIIINSPNVERLDSSWPLLTCPTETIQGCLSRWVDLLF